METVISICDWEIQKSLKYETEKNKKDAKSGDLI